MPPTNRRNLGQCFSRREAGDRSLSAELKEDLDNRLVAADATREASVPWEDVKKMVMDRIWK